MACASHLLLLTATPHMGKAYPYFALWRLLEPDVLSTPDAFEQYPHEQRRLHFIRRTKEEMVRIDGNPLYPRRISDTLGFALSQGDASEQALYEKATDYLRYVYNRAKLLNRSAARLAMGVFQRRLASSTYALLCSFERRIEKLDKIIDDVRSGRLTMEQLLILQRKIREDDVFELKSADEENCEGGAEENELTEEKILQGVVAESFHELVAEKEQLLLLRELAKKVCESGTESKFEKLREIIAAKQYEQEKFLVFTEHRDTLEYLVDRLKGMGHTGRIAKIHGGMHYSERHEQIEFFRRSDEYGGARFMICTDAASEGVNLQFCWIMINYDIPWNPARLEQRMGRIHRYGQKHDPVAIVNLVAPETREGRVLKTLLEKLGKIRKQLHSDKVFDSIGRVFSEVSIKSYMERLVSDEDVDRIEKDLDGRLTKEQIEAIAEREKRLFGDGGDVKKELPRLRECLEQETFFKLIPGYVRNFVLSAAPLIGLEIEGDTGSLFGLKPADKKSADGIIPAIEGYWSAHSLQLSISRPDDPLSCVWMHPGEPVFEIFREHVRNKLGKDALRGAVFVDPTAENSYFFHLARLSVVRRADPEISSLAHEETLECRLLGIRQEEDGKIEVCAPEHLLLLRGGRGLPAQAQRMAIRAEDFCEQVERYLFESVCRSLADKHRDSRAASLSERESFIRRGHDFREAELANARAKVAKKARAGNKRAMAELDRIKKKQRDLYNKLEAALLVIRREAELIEPGNVEFIAHALVTPSVDPEELAWRQTNVESIAMELTKAFEEARGASVKFVHTPKLALAAGLREHPGFDILSQRPDRLRRCIEVKGRAGKGEVEITDNEWARACNLRHEYWLYVAYRCDSPSPVLVRIQDPFGKLIARSFCKIGNVEKTIKANVESQVYKIPYSQIMEVGRV